MTISHIAKQDYQYMMFNICLLSRFFFFVRYRLDVGRSMGVYPTRRLGEYAESIKYL